MPAIDRRIPPPASRRLPRPGLRVVLLLALMALPAVPAAAQSPGDLRRENERLRQEVAELRAQVDRLTAQLAEAERTAAALQERIAELEAGRPDGTPGAAGTPGDAATDGTPAADEPVITVDESKPQASPRALQAEARRRWERGPGATDPGIDAASPQRINHLRVLEAWIREQERTWRMEVEWIVEPVEPGPPSSTGTTWMMQARDPITDAVIGRPFAVHARRSVARTFDRELARAESDGRPTDRLVLAGDVVVRFTVDPARREPGTFDRPPLLAPFVTFEFGIEARRLEPRPATKPPVTPAPTEGDPATGGGGGGGDGSGGDGSTGGTGGTGGDATSAGG